jgi:PAS domain S-box-containing protein
MDSSLQDHDRFAVLRIVGIYALVGGLWIYFSDTVLSWLVNDQTIMTHVSISKGILFIVITASLLYLLIHRQMDRLTRRTRLIQDREFFLQSIATNIPGVLYQFYVLDTGPYGVSYVSQKAGNVFDVPSDLSTFFPLFTARIFEEDRNRFLESIHEAVAAGAPWKFVGRFVKRNGDLMWIQGMSTPQREKDRLLYHGVLLDVTEHKQAKETRRESEAMMQSLLAATPAGVALLKNRTFIQVNAALCRITGYSAEEMAGMQTRILYPDEEEFLRIGKELYDQMEREGLGVKESMLRRKDGTPIVVILSLSPFDPGDPSAGVCATVLDITKRKQAEEELRDKTEQLEALRLVSVEIARELDLTCLLGLIHRRAGELLGVNAGFISLYDEATQSLTLRSWQGHGDWVQGLRFRLGQGISGNVALQRRGMVVNDYRTSPHAMPLILENTTVTSIVAEPLVYRDRLVGVVTVDNHGIEERTFGEKDRAVLHLFAAQAAIAIENARLFEAAQQELAERNRAEKALRESEELYRTLVETSPDPILMYDLDGKILAASTQAAKIYGVASVEEFLREVKTVFDVLVGDGKTLAAAHFSKALAQRTARKSEYLVRLRDGSTIPMEVNSSIVRNTSGERCAVMAVLRDITDRKRSESITIAQRDLGLALVKATSIEDTLRLCLGAALKVSEADSGGIYIIDPLSGDLDLACFQGVSEQFAERVNHYDSGSDRIRLVMQGNPLYVEGADDLVAYNEGDLIEEGIRSMALIPVGNKDMIIGSLNVTSHVSDNIPEYSRNALETIASQMGPYIVKVRAEEALRESESKFRDLAEESIVGIYLIQDDLFKYVNAGFAHIFGYPIEELIDHLGPEDVLLPEDLSLMGEKIRKSMVSEAESLRYEFRILTKDRQVKHVEIYGSRTLYRGKPATIGTLLDITDRRKTEEELRRLSIAIEQAAEDIVITDPEGVIQYVNPAFEKIMGYSRGEAIGQNPRILKSGVHESAFYEDLWNTIKGGNIWSGRITNRRKDGKLIQEDATISPLLTSGNKLTGYVALKRDVTEAVRLESHLRQSQKMEAIGTLAGGIAHDFNNILAAMMGYTELVKFTTTDAKIHPYLEQILKACARSRDLVQQILTFSRQREHEKKPLAVTPIVKEALKLLRSSIPTTIEIRQHYDARYDTVFSDSTQIHQVLMNLCTNAVHAMREREGVLLVSLGQQVISADHPAYHPELKEGDYLHLVVSDTGEGMDPDIKAKIFDPFFTTKKAGEGTGLGLSVVYGIVKDHGGVIAVESERGKGTVFAVWLPLIAADEEQEQEVVSIPRGKGCILYVDDEEPIASLGREMLDSLGYEVTIRCSSHDALEVFRAHPERFDMVITDMTMPNMTGANLAREMLKIRPGIPIILTTGFSERINEEEAKRIGIREFLMKPVSLSSLAHVVKRIMDTEA